MADCGRVTDASQEEVAEGGGIEAKNRVVKAEEQVGSHELREVLGCVTNGDLLPDCDVRAPNRKVAVHVDRVALGRQSAQAEDGRQDEFTV